MDNKYLLSICIPTYNREKQLKRLLDNIVSQKWFSDSIEIYIYDDPSTDDTELMVHAYMEKYKNINYHRNTTRLGMMPSILESILHCSWEYIWLFWSDDFMWPFGISTMLSLIKTEKPDLILSNFWRWINNIDYTNDKLIYKNYNNVENFCNNFWKQRPEYSYPTATDRYAALFSYMSIYCFRSDLFRSLHNITLTQKKKSYILNHYLHYIYILLWNNKIKHICLCSSPTLTYLIWWWWHSRTMNARVMRDAYSIFALLNKYYKINIKTKLLFIWLIIYWIKIRCIAKIAILAQRFGCYDKLSYMWRKYILKSE